MLGSILLICLAAGPTPNDALVVRHLPPTEGQAGFPLELRAAVAPAHRLDGLWVYYRAEGEAAYQRAAFGRDVDGSYAARVDLPQSAGMFDYYLVGQELGQSAKEVFASAAKPYEVLVHADADIEETRGWLSHVGGARSRFDLSGEWVDYGKAIAPDGTIYADHYYRGELAYRYAILDTFAGLRIDTIRLGVGTMRATVPPVDGALELYSAGGKSGLDYGFSEVTVDLSPYVGLTSKLIIGGNRAGFAAGGGGKLRIGRSFGSRVELETESTSGVGTSGTFRLCWATVPRVPMSAAVQLTDVPTGAYGIRFMYRADWEIRPTMVVGALIGYQARRSVGGGVSVGLGASYGW
jgi:hypothetical protein